MKLTFIIFLTFPSILFAQENTYIKTDSSIIKTVYYEILNSIREFNELTDCNKTYFKDFYYDTKKIKKEGVFFNEYSTGIWREYSEEGKLISEINHDLGIWRVKDKSKFPFFDIQNSIKTKGDSIIEKVYGKAFLEKNAIWSLDGSYIYNEKEAGRWEDSFKNKPNKFLMRYKIKLDSINVYNDIIAFKLDSIGNFIPNKYEQIYGFEQLPENQKGELKISVKKAIEKARENGLVENDSTKADYFLKWENVESDKFYKGQFRFYVMIETKTIENIIPQGRSSRETKYDVYSFNPWSWEFIEKKKMKSIYSWEKYSGNRTGLLPDYD